MSTPASVTLGVVGGPQIAAHLAEAGFSVVGHEDFSEAAKAVTAAIRTSRLAAVIVVDSQQAPPGTNVWARSTSAKVPMAVLRNGPATSNLPAGDRAIEVQMPANLAEVLLELSVEMGLASLVDVTVQAGSNEALVIAGMQDIPLSTNETEGQGVNGQSPQVVVAPGDYTSDISAPPAPQESVSTPDSASTPAAEDTSRHHGPAAQRAVSPPMSRRQRRELERAAEAVEQGAPVMHQTGVGSSGETPASNPPAVQVPVPALTPAVEAGAESPSYEQPSGLGSYTRPMEPAAHSTAFQQPPTSPAQTWQDTDPGTAGRSSTVPSHSEHPSLSGFAGGTAAPQFPAAGSLSSRPYPDPPHSHSAPEAPAEFPTFEPLPEHPEQPQDTLPDDLSRYEQGGFTEPSTTQLPPSEPHWQHGQQQPYAGGGSTAYAQYPADLPPVAGNQHRAPETHNWGAPAADQHFGDQHFAQNGFGQQNGVSGQHDQGTAQHFPAPPEQVASAFPSQPAPQYEEHHPATQGADQSRTGAQVAQPRQFTAVHQPGSMTAVMDAMGQVAPPASFEDSAPTVGRRPGTKVGNLIIPIASKGGVGKSTSSLALAQRAATMGPEGFRVVLIDANRGQGDLRTFLRLPSGALPTIYDAAVSGNPADALITPQQLSSARGDEWGDVGFAFVAAPPSEAARSELTGSGTYRDVIDYARTVADLVVVDTQIAESYDTSGLFDDVIVPMLADDAWAFGVSDMSTPGVMNLMERLKDFGARGVSRDRTLLSLNFATKADASSMEPLSNYLSTAGTYLGAIEHDPRLRGDMNVGRPIGEHKVLAKVIDSALYAVTGHPIFDAGSKRRAGATRTPSTRRKGLFGRKK